jgi:hypothetical protein
VSTSPMRRSRESSTTLLIDMHVVEANMLYSIA